MPKGKEASHAISFKDDFCSDLSLKDMLYAVTIRSPISQGIITSISLDQSFEHCTLITARDVPGSNLIDTIEGKVSVFCGGNISYKGEAIGLLVAPDEKTLAQALESIQINYDESPIESYVGNSEYENTNLFRSEIRERKVESGHCFDIESGKSKGIDAVLAESSFCVKGDWTYALCPKNYREPCGALCSYNKDSLTVYSPSQWINNLRIDLSEVLKLDSDSVKIYRTKAFDRSTNSIWYNSIIACQAAVASYCTQKPVKLIYSRHEQEEYINCIKPIAFHTELGADETGKLTAVKVQANVDSGSTNVFIGEIIDRLAIASCSCYKAENVSISVKATPSNTPPISLDLQLIDSAAFFAAENALSQLASAMNTKPEESLSFPSDIRKQNINNTNDDDDSKEENAGADFSVPFSFYLPRYEEAIEALFESSDFKNKYIFYNRESLARSLGKQTILSPSPFSAPVRGIGFSCGFEGSFYYGSKIYDANQEMEVSVEENGDVLIHCPPLSRTIQEIWTKIVSDILGVRSSAVKIDSTFEAGSEPVLPESAYANISIMTVLLKKCCEVIRKKKDDSGQPISVKRKLGSVQRKEWNTQDFRGKPFHSCSFAAATVEVEIDSCTYRNKIRSINVVISGGQILNSVAAEATIKLGIQKILASLIEDDIISCDKIKISFMKSDGNPEQIGELVYQMIPSAYTQALSQALGTIVHSLPLKPDSIYRILTEPKENTEAYTNNIEQVVKNADSGNAE